MEGDPEEFSVSKSVKKVILEISELWIKRFHNCLLEKEYLSKSLDKKIISLLFFLIRPVKIITKKQ